MFCVDKKSRNFIVFYTHFSSDDNFDEYFARKNDIEKIETIANEQVGSVWKNLNDRCSVDFEFCRVDFATFCRVLARFSFFDVDFSRSRRIF